MARINFYPNAELSIADPPPRSPGISSATLLQALWNGLDADIRHLGNMRLDAFNRMLPDLVRNATEYEVRYEPFAFGTIITVTLDGVTRTYAVMDEPDLAWEDIVHIPTTRHRKHERVNWMKEGF